MIKKIVVLTVLSILIVTTARAEMKLKIAVVNPSQTEEQTSSVTYDLPKGIGPDQVLDAGDLELNYDFDRDVYYLTGEVVLEPAEKKILEVSLRDVWEIPAKEMDYLTERTTALVHKLVKTKHAEVGNTLSLQIAAALKDIETRQKETATLTARDRINRYYENVRRLEEVKDDIGMLENLVLDVGGLVEERVRIPTTLTCLITRDTEPDPKDILELRIRVSNPSETDVKKTPVKYDLPPEVTPRCIVDSADLQLSYDFNKECFYVFADDVELQPGESREYIVRIRDIWQIAVLELDALQSHTRNLLVLLEGTPYMAQARPIADKIGENLNKIATVQAMDVEAAKHISYYRDNVVTLADTKTLVAQLEKVVTQSGASPGVTIAKAERMEGGGPQPRRPRGYEGITMLAETIFRGKAPTVATTWKIIFIILGFIGIISVTFYALWFIQAKKGQRKEKPPQQPPPQTP